MGSSNWFTVTEAKVVYVPLKGGRDGGEDEKTRFARTGIRINMADGSWWFHHFKHNSWTKHWPLVRAMDRLGRPATELGGEPVYLPERVDRYGQFSKVVKEYGTRVPQLVTALLEGKDSALEAEAEARSH